MDNQSQKNPTTQNTKDDPINRNSTENSSNTANTDNNDTIKKADSANNAPAKEEDSSLKVKYLKKLNDTKKAMDDLKPTDTSTFALKKVEHDRYGAWDELVNEVYEVLKEMLPAEEMDQLRNEQRNWIQYRDNSAKEASLKYEGGTAEQLEYVAVAANLTEERCYELVEEYMKK